jgi:hypothetical protein
LPRQVAAEVKSELLPTSALAQSSRLGRSSLGRSSQHVGASAPVQFAKGPRLHIPLMEICKLSTPLVKRVPNSQRASFAVEWGRLLSQALEDELEVSWSEFFVFPRCILWSPPRGGKRVTKKAKFNDVVKSRLASGRRTASKSFGPTSCRGREGSLRRFLRSTSSEMASAWKQRSSQRSAWGMFARRCSF